MAQRTASLTPVTLLAMILVGGRACAPRQEAHVQEASANFDLQDVEPFLTRVAALCDSGFATAQVTALAADIAQQPVHAKREHTYPVVAQGAHTALRIVVSMDDVNSPDIYFFTNATLAGRISTAMKKYFEEVGK